MNNGQFVGYDPQTGQPIYTNQPVVYPNNNPVPTPPQQVLNTYGNPAVVVKEEKKKSPLVWIVLLIVAIAALIIVGVIFFHSKSENKEKSRTFMIYMVGSKSLETSKGLATLDLEAIDYNTTSSKNINVVVVAGGTPQWKNNYIDSSETSIYELTANGYQKVKTQELKNMGDSQVLSDFLKYVYENYKTDEYDLVFWDHGGAIGGAEFDDLSNDNLELPEIANALSNSPFSSKNKLEAVVFRTCLNGTLEVAGTLDEYADYLVASEETTIGHVYSDALGFINDVEMTDDGYAIGEKFIASYRELVDTYKSIVNSSFNYQYLYSTYSIVDLSHVKELETSVNDFFTSINLTNNYGEIAKVRSNLYQYGVSDGVNYYDMVDLYKLVDGLKELNPDKAQVVLDNLGKVVLFNFATNDSSRGMSIYFPFNCSDAYSQAYLRMYNGFSNLDGYRKFIATFYQMKNATSSGNYFAQTPPKVETSADADFTLQLTDEEKEVFAKASYIVFRDNKDGYYLPVYRGNQVTLDGNTLKANIQDRQLKIVSDEEDKLEYIIVLREQDETNEYITYTTSVLLEDFSVEEIADWKMDNATLSLVYDKVSGNIGIGSAVLNEDGKASTVAVDVHDYSTIAFASSKYKILDANGKYTENWESNGIIEGLEVSPDKFHFALQNFDDGNDYYCVFIIWDIYNHSYYSKLVKMN